MPRKRRRLAAMGDSPRAIGHYSAAEVGRLAGVSARRIGQWARYGLIPSVSKHPRVYSYADAGEAVLVKYLIEQDFRPRHVRKIVDDLRKRFGLWPLATAPLEHDGRLLVIREGNDVFISVEFEEQHVIAGTLLNLEEVRRALAMGGWVAWRHQRAYIEVDPERLSGRPTVRGRRIATATVADLAQRPEGRQTLYEDFGLSDEEIEDAVSYEADVNEAVAV